MSIYGNHILYWIDFLKCMYHTRTLFLSTYLSVYTWIHIALFYLIHVYNKAKSNDFLLKFYLQITHNYSWPFVQNLSFSRKATSIFSKFNTLQCLSLTSSGFKHFQGLFRPKSFLLSFSIFFQKLIKFIHVAWKNELLP